jgi:methionyl-tRNA synthetase
MRRMAEGTPFFITTAIAYVNGPPHLGHAYEAISTDVMARFKRLDGYDVFFLTGTDEHGQKVAKSATAAGKPTKQFCDEIAALFKDMHALLGSSYDQFIRTTEERHYAASQALWHKIDEAGDIYLGSYSGWYSVRDEAYFGEEELTKGGDGKMYAPSGAEVEWVEEPSYFFKLSEYGDKLLAYYEAHPDFIAPAFRKNEVVSFVKQGLRDLSISRTTFDWGVPVPDAPGHIMYVWLDALTNYITALGYPDEGGAMAKYWPADIHVIGKDIVRFHTIYWPAFLMSAGVTVPKRVFGHGFLNVEGAKMSKSLGNVLSPKAMVEEFGLDELRYFLLREVPYGQDGSFSREQIIHRINGDLANDLGNLAQRVLSMIAKNFGGVLPAPRAFTAGDDELLGAAHGLLETVREKMEVQAYHEALEAIWVVVRAANAYVDKEAPWSLGKTDPVRQGTILYVVVETLRHLAILMQPFTPGAAEKLLDQLGAARDARDCGHLGPDHALAGGTPLPKPEGVFPRFVEPEAAARGKGAA